ncbi:unnamed protein product, partial [Mesorhabditis spiculigera]
MGENQPHLDRAALTQLPPEKLVEKVLQYQILLQELNEDYDDLKRSTEEMETLQEQEIEALRKENSDLRRDHQALKENHEAMKERYTAERTELLKNDEKQKAQLAQFTADSVKNRKRIMILESEKDSALEAVRVREATIMLTDQKLDDALERMAVLETCLAQKSSSMEELNSVKSSTRPLATVEPLKAQPLLDDHDMEVNEAEMNENQSPQRLAAGADADDSKKPPAPTTPMTGIHTTVNRAVRSLLNKLDRLENLLMTARSTTPSQTSV